MSEEKENRKVNVFSVTFRPPDGLLPDIDIIIAWLKSNAEKWVCNLEQNNHFQIAAYFKKAMRTDHLRRRLSIPFGDTTTVALKVKAHDNWKLLAGYCSKEGATNNHNLDDDEFKECVQEYDKFGKFRGKNKFKFMNIDQIAQYVKDAFIEDKVNLNEKNINHVMKEIRDKIPFSVYQRINKLTLLSYISLYFDDPKDDRE